jgi:hypothetical protein
VTAEGELSAMKFLQRVVAFPEQAREQTNRQEKLEIVEIVILNDGILNMGPALKKECLFRISRVAVRILSAPEFATQSTTAIGILTTPTFEYGVQCPLPKSRLFANRHQYAQSHQRKLIS